MPHCLHVLSTDAGFQALRGAQTLAGSDDQISSHIKTIGRGGSWRSVPSATWGLRYSRADLVHAWDMPSLLSAALAATRGNQIRAADLLGVNRNTLRKKIRDLDIQVYRSSN